MDVQPEVAWQHRKAAASAVHADVGMDDISHSAWKAVIKMIMAARPTKAAMTAMAQSVATALWVGGVGTRLRRGGKGGQLTQLVLLWGRGWPGRPGRGCSTMTV